MGVDRVGRASEVFFFSLASNVGCCMLIFFSAGVIEDGGRTITTFDSPLIVEISSRVMHAWLIALLCLLRKKASLKSVVF